jgi:hypothetical protein
MSTMTTNPTDPTTWNVGDLIADEFGRRFYVLTPPYGPGTFQIGEEADGADLLRSESARSLRVYTDGLAKWTKTGTPFRRVQEAGQ